MWLQESPYHEGNEAVLRHPQAPLRHLTIDFGTLQALTNPEISNEDEAGEELVDMLMTQKDD